MEWNRKTWLSTLSKAGPEAVIELWDRLGLAPEFKVLRAPECGLVMTQGRMGGTGDAFNLGEMTVTRCSVTLTDGRTGHAYVAGRSKQHAEVVAQIDALMQGSEAALISEEVLQPLRKSLEARREEAGKKAAATRVEFFTLSRSADVK